MKKSNVTMWTRGSAEYVVMHAKWRKSRKRRPSESFGGESNPRKALILAAAKVIENHAKISLRVSLAG